MRMTGNSSTQSTYYILARLVDNLNQDIDSSGPDDYVYATMTNGSYTKTHNMNIARGRISSYDNNPIDTNDILLMQDYLLGDVPLSSLQYALADYNGDGSVNGADLTAMQQQVATSNGQTMSLQECENMIMGNISHKLGNGETFEAFMTGELAIDTKIPAI